jgi:hypothetical protein
MIYKVGDSVTCAESDDKKNLTAGKVYKVLDSTTSGVKIEDDVGTPRRVDYEFLIPLKIDGIGNNTAKFKFNRDGGGVFAIVSGGYKLSTGDLVCINGVVLQVTLSMHNHNKCSLVTVKKASDHLQEQAKFL